MAAQLEAIPPELLSIVLDDLDGETPPLKRLKAFSALSLVSKTLQAAATPYLYKTHHLPMPNRGRRSTQLVNSVCRNPNLAKHVRCIHFASNEERPETPPTWDDIQVLATASAPLKALPVYGVISLALGSGCYTALSILLVSLSTQLMSLHVDLRQHSDQWTLAADPLAAMERAATIPEAPKRCKCCPHAAQCLEALFNCEQLRNRYKRLAEIYPIGKGVDDFGTVLGFMRVPSLQTLACEGFGSLIKSYGWGAASVISNVAHLKLECGFLLMDDLAGILSCFKGLRELDLEWDFGIVYRYAETLSPRPPGFNVPSIFAALKPHAMTLERLSMTDAAGARTFRSKVDTLQDFHKLRKLAVDAEILIGRGTWASTGMKLPPNLTGLTIHMPGSLEDLPDVCEALGRARSATLKDVLLAFPVMDGVNEDWHNVGGNLQTGIGSDEGTKEWTYGLYYDEENEDGDHSGLNFWCYGDSLSNGLEEMCTMMRMYGVRWLLSREAHSSEITPSCRYPLMW